MEEEQIGTFSIRNHENDVIDKFYNFYLKTTDNEFYFEFN